MPMARASPTLVAKLRRYQKGSPQGCNRGKAFVPLLLASLVVVAYLAGCLNSAEQPPRNISAESVAALSHAAQLASAAAGPEALRIALALHLRTTVASGGTSAAWLPDPHDRLPHPHGAVPRFLHLLGGALSGTGRLLSCSVDATLPGPLAAAAPLGPRQLFLAANLKESADVLPNFVAQLLVLATRLPPGALFVSIYASDSEDHTPLWLLLLQALLESIGVASKIVPNGTLQRPRPHTPENRIPFLAAVRNAALQPIYEQLETLSAEAAREARVIFLNDVYFCATDVLRLLQHRAADVACGLDMTRIWQKVPRLNKSPLRHLLQLEFYDCWVSRDINGRMFNRYAPYVSDPTSKARMGQGLPFRVHTCWNGLAVIRAEPFRQGVRFHAPMEGSCNASECSLLVADLHARGFSEVVLDPGVRVAYTLPLAADLRAGLVHRSRLLSWKEVEAAPSWQQLPHVLPSRVECCEKPYHDGLPDGIDFGACYMKAAEYRQHPARR